MSTLTKSQQITFTFEKQKIFNSKERDFKVYSKFRDGKDFDNHWEQFMVDYKINFSPLQLDAIRVVRQFAYNNFGVCNASYRTLIEASEEMYGYGISRDTFRTSLQKLENLGFVMVHEGQRLEKGHGSRTANVVIFNRIEEVRAYQIIQKKKKDQEMKRLLEEEFERVSPVVNFAIKGKQWAEEKKVKQAQRAAAEAEKKRKEAEEAQKAKKVSLYRKIAIHLSQQKAAKSLNLNEFVKIAYGSAKKLVETTEMTKEQAEELAYNKLVEVFNKENVKNYAALFSWSMKQVQKAINGEVSKMSNAEIQTKQGKHIEYIPEWIIVLETCPVKRAEMRSNNEYLTKRMKEHKQLKHTQNEDTEHLQGAFDEARKRLLAVTNLKEQG